jgi:cysteine desulfuration protein SufE
MSERINKIQDKIINEFSKFDDWFEKYEYLIELGRNLKPLDEKYKTEENSISGCQSQLWIASKIKGEKIQFFADSDSLITKGMISIILRVVSNNEPKDIIDANLYFIEKIGLKTNLSPLRANGLQSILKHIKNSAEKFTQ